MNQTSSIDAALITWGDRLFYPGNRMVKSKLRLSVALRAKATPGHGVKVARSLRRPDESTRSQ